MCEKEKQLSLVEHLTEFRNRFVASVVFFLLAFSGSLCFVSSIYRFLTQNISNKLIVLGPNDILWIYIRLASIVAFSLTLPFFVYQMWAFISPALHKRERRSIFFYLPAVFICFVLGLLFGFYFVSPAILQVLLSLGEDLFETQLTAQNYLTFLFHTTLPFAFVFEMPVMSACLTSFGILTPHFMIKYRRQAYFILLVLAVVLTPADFISDLAMAAPLFGIYELSVAISKWVMYKRQKRRV